MEKLSSAQDLLFCGLVGLDTNRSVARPVRKSEDVLHLYLRLGAAVLLLWIPTKITALSQVR
jgi:hypothetical protein